MDISKINSLYSALGTATNPLSAGSSNFADYFFSATSKVEQDKDKVNSLFTDLSGFGTSSALQGLLSGAGQAGAIESYLQLSTVNNPTASDTFSSYLQTNFQAQQMKTMSAAKDKLTVQMTAFEQTIGDTPSDIARLQLEQMQKNIRVVEDYLAEKQQQQSVNNNLLGQLQSSSAFTQYLLTQQKSLF